MTPQNEIRIFIATENFLNKWEDLILQQQNLLMEIFSNFEVVLPLEKNLLSTKKSPPHTSTPNSSQILDKTN